jgi:hypothetical protein
MLIIVFNPVLDYFTKTSPNFVNARGQTIDAHSQVDAFAQAQSIGKYMLIPLDGSELIGYFANSVPFNIHHPVFQRQFSFVPFYFLQC